MRNGGSLSRSLGLSPLSRFPLCVLCYLSFGSLSFVFGVISSCLSVSRFLCYPLLSLCLSPLLSHALVFSLLSLSHLCLSPLLALSSLSLASLVFFLSVSRLLCYLSFLSVSCSSFISLVSLSCLSLASLVSFFYCLSCL